MGYSFYSEQNICQKKGKFRPSQTSAGNLNTFTHLRRDAPCFRTGGSTSAKGYGRRCPQACSAIVAKKATKAG